MAWKEQIKYYNYHVADLYSVGNQFGSWQDYFLSLPRFIIASFQHIKANRVTGYEG